MDIQQYDFLKEAIEKQIEISKSTDTFHSLVTNKRWFYKQSFTKEQYQEFQKWFVDNYKQKFSSKLNEAKEAFQVFDMNFGFRVEGEELELSDSELVEELNT